LNLFYGIFSGAWNPKVEADGHATKEGWMTASNAAAWARYAPIFRELDEAGWRPITDARSSEPDVWIERFGSLAEHDLHFTIRNDTGAPRRATIWILVGSLGGHGTPRVAEQVTRTNLAVRSGTGVA